MKKDNEREIYFPQLYLIHSTKQEPNNSDFSGGKKKGKICFGVFESLSLYHAWNTFTIFFMKTVGNRIGVGDSFDFETIQHFRTNGCDDLLGIRAQ